MGEGSRLTSAWMGVPLKNVSLVLLTAQYSTFILLLHYSRVMPLVGGHRYLTSTAVFLNEVIKLAICLTVSLYEISRSMPNAPATSLFSALTSAIFSGDSWKLAIPASLYTLANSLQYVGISNLEAATFQVTYQLKIITTALFSMAILRRSLSAKKWLALLLLMGGVAIVQMDNGGPSDALMSKGDPARLQTFLPRSLNDLLGLGSEGSKMTKRSATYEGIAEDEMIQNPRLNASLGLLAVIGACISSGAAGVYFEKILKDSVNPSSLWIRNVQLATYSLFPALFIGVVFLDGETIAKDGFFLGYNWVVWSAVGVQAIAGIIVAFCMFYADNIAKNFSASISIVISTLASFCFFDFRVTRNFLLGTTVVISATYLYSSHDHRPSRPPPIRVHDYEKSNGAAGELKPQNCSIKLPTTPLINEEMGLTTSRPGSPNSRHHSRVGSGRGYFGKDHHRKD